MASKTQLVYGVAAALAVLLIAFIVTRPATLPDAGDLHVLTGVPAFLNSGGRAVRGAPNAKVHLVEFSDFQCPFCKQNEAAMSALLKDYPTEISLEYREFPLPNAHPYAWNAAEAFECAVDQNVSKAWALHDVMFDKQPALDIPYLKSYARAVGLDGPTFDACLDSGKKNDMVARDEALGVKLGVESTPTVFVEGTPIIGTNPESTYQQVIDSLLGR